MRHVPLRGAVSWPPDGRAVVLKCIATLEATKPTPQAVMGDILNSLHVFLSLQALDELSLGFRRAAHGYLVDFLDTGEVTSDPAHARTNTSQESQSNPNQASNTATLHAERFVLQLCVCFESIDATSLATLSHQALPGEKSGEHTSPRVTQAHLSSSTHRRSEACVYVASILLHFKL